MNTRLGPSTVYQGRGCRVVVTYHPRPHDPSVYAEVRAIWECLGAGPESNVWQVRTYDRFLYLLTLKPPFVRRWPGIDEYARIITDKAILLAERKWANSFLPYESAWLHVNNIKKMMARQNPQTEVA